MNHDMKRNLSMHRFCMLCSIFTVTKYHIMILSAEVASVAFQCATLTLILLMWTIWRAPTNASKWRMGFNSGFKRLIKERQCILVQSRMLQSTFVSSILQSSNVISSYQFKQRVTWVKQYR